MPNTLARWCVFMLFMVAPVAAHASAEYIGEKECYACHKDIKKVYLGNIHGRIFTKNPGNSLESRGCEACHGPGSAHKDAADRIDSGENAPLDVEFPFNKEREAVDTNNKRCLTCHERGVNMHWHGSEHEMSEVSCVDCHTIHEAGEIDGTEVCIKCHVERRAQLQRSSHIPVREGKVKCSSCHNPHGSMGPTLLKTSSVNESCYSCHAEKRGPMLWEHAPVRENCTNCHNPHGSNYGALLKMKTPYLCQTCHMAQYHPSELYEGSLLSPADKHLAGKACLNCHSLIHGSNHPSGTRFQR